MQDKSPGNLIDRYELHPRYFVVYCMKLTFYMLSFLCRYTTWVDPKWTPAVPQCQGHVHRGICNFGVLDLPPFLTRDKALFLNKFDLPADSLAVQCWSEHIASHGG